ncbi:hypothetical protein M0804_009735 [Polistes exclamans]|nr:hypothetical protein M0804_009735 [Polistes exclamans]
MLILITWFFFLHRISAEQSIVEEWSVNVTTSSISLTMEETKTIPFFVVINSKNLENLSFNYVSTSPDIATVTGVITSKSDNYWNGTLNITGIFLGTAKIKFQFVRNNNIEDKEVLFVTVMRYQGVIDKIFTASVGILVSILYINFGCAMDWDACRKTLRKPVGPAIGCFCQFFFMPLLSYGIGYCLFPDQPELQIGMFFTGISPSGGASNVWTVMLDGNLNLSVTMTTLCTILAFGFMPFWLFTLGKHIFDRGELGVPYDHVAMFAVGLIFPLLIGFCIQKKLPKIIVAGMGLPWLGFIFGMLVALIFKQSRQDIIAIAIETGIQNTGVAIFLLRLSLKSPADDLTTVLPVSSAIMTPIPLTILYLLKVIFNCRRKHQKVNNTSESLENSESYAEPTSVVQSN